MANIEYEVKIIPRSSSQNLEAMMLQALGGIDLNLRNQTDNQVGVTALREIEINDIFFREPLNTEIGLRRVIVSAATANSHAVIENDTLTIEINEALEDGKEIPGDIFAVASIFQLMNLCMAVNLTGANKTPIFDSYERLATFSTNKIWAEKIRLRTITDKENSQTVFTVKDKVNGKVSGVNEKRKESIGVKNREEMYAFLEALGLESYSLTNKIRNTYLVPLLARNGTVETIANVSIDKDMSPFHTVYAEVEGASREWVLKCFNELKMHTGDELECGPWSIDEAVQRLDTLKYVS